ncbi:hypothetical protein [Bradyrhizobium sp. 144]|uniref:hypothetical protein n=1 Tax=Bradyrhizobium sp. 144 TaxID=2782620 RepID=UPI001FFAC3BB|nr:hypothetical protein [Bradyrhizobium sp. 144]MCK1693093.1 hypothetical protein [Bradyrhizobium sp. 144]
MAVLAMLEPGVAGEGQFPQMMVKQTQAVVCKYLLGAKSVAYWIVKQRFDEAAKVQHCVVLPMGTIVSAQDTDGGEFVGVAVEFGPHKGLVGWTNAGWLQEVK